MNKVPVRIEIHTSQTLEDGTAQTYDSREGGFLYQKGTSFYLSYLEASEDGETGTQTIWKVEPEQVSLIRQGETGLRALFKMGSAERTALVTPHGILPIEIDTFHLEHDFTPEGGFLRVGYNMDIGGAMTRMELELRVKRQEPIFAASKNISKK
ncbi:DUF1934 domain-containing protein [Effusibacillus consociatus]|uniref:DUF1934 domain-containing protein n=1 Tax=Effusibacillus consociatus TaxID=1117041 RepID=A0ABV9Q222_9BACL